MRWFYLKNGTQNSEIDRLEAKTPTAVIYFGETRVKEFLAGKGDKQGQDFCKAGLSKNRNKTTIVLTCRGVVWLLQPASEVREEKRRKHENGDPYIPKTMTVKILAKKDSMDVPAVLAGIGANAYLGRGTFREISHWGDIKAIEMVLGRGIPKEHKDEGPEQLLECLSSVELETLVAKLFEAAGCFVAAYRGGTTMAVDVVTHNDTAKSIHLDGITIKPRSRISVQVKGWQSGMTCSDAVDYLIGLDVKIGAKTFGATWLLNQVRQFPDVAKWLHRSLNWLPNDYLKQWKLA